MTELQARLDELRANLLGARAGVGPLLQRDYWALIDGCRLRPSEVVDFVARRFPELAPDELAQFSREPGTEAVPRLGEELSVRIAGAGTFRVRLVHRDLQSFTFGTLTGHPEAGRITFGAYRNPYGDVIFHIRSIARSSSRTRLLGFRLAGEPMQTTTWTDFVDRVALATGTGVIGFVHAETRRLDDDACEDDACEPTYLARGE